MFRPLEAFIGLRYIRAKRRNHFISFISLISIAGIALGIMALITVLSVMNGFEEELRSRILGMAAHITLEGNGQPVKDWKSLETVVEKTGLVAAAAPYVQGETMITHKGQVSGGLVRGILPEEESTVSIVTEHMKVGATTDLAPGSYNIILGQELAWSLGVSPGDRVTLISPQANMTAVGMIPRLRRFTVTGIFEIGMYEYDRSLALVHMEDAAKLFQKGEGVSGVRLRVDDLFQAPVIARELATVLPPGLRVSDWTRQHASFFQAIRTEKRVMFIILALIVAVAAFNIVSTLVMVVTDKRADIAILRTLGVSPGTVMRIFMIQGFSIGAIGILIGVTSGIVLALNVEQIVPAIERMFGVQFLAPDVYYISELPSRLEWRDVWQVSGVAFVLSLIATLYPAWRAARTRPAEALRYE